ncbi:MAG: T9SS type A sorting domain-containing protein [Saprospiraceae bacterium]
MRSIFTKTIFILFILGMSFPSLEGQTTFSDNFDSYTSGDFLCVSSSKWKTWDNKPGTATDTKIVNDKAASGANALKIFAANATGGPTDILLPFGGRYNSGIFVIEWKMFIESGKHAYFNFQGNETPGVLWTLNGYLRTNNALELTGSNNARLFATTYPSDEWFTFGLEINLTTNNWKVLINGECQGAFSNTNTFIAGMNLYPTDNNCTFYCDDFSYSYDPVAPTLENDAAIDNITWNNIGFTGTEDNFTFKVTNLGVENLLELEVDATLNGNPLSLDLSEVELASGESKVITSTEKITLVEGANTIEIQVSKVNGQIGDQEECNNKTSLTIEGVTPAVNKAVLIEEATGTWCQWCPRGAIFLDLLSKKYNKTYVPIAVHNNDPMAVVAYDALVRATPGFTGFPGVIVNRALVTDPSTSEAPFLQRITVPAPAYFVTGAKYDATSRNLDVSITTIFQQDVSTPMWINMVISEDGVKGTGSGYNQSNAYAGGGSGPMGGYELLPNPVPASQMIYDHVGRIITGIQKNTDNSLDGPYQAGQSVIKSFSFTLPAGINIDKCNIIPILLSGSGYENAAISSIDEAFSNGYVKTENVILENSFTTYPNPTNDEVFVDFSVKTNSDIIIELTDITGKLVASKLHSNMKGDYTLPVSVASFNPGMYLISIRTNQEIITQKIMVSK